MKEPFELEWMGGPAEHHFRKARPGVDEMPWGTLDPSKFAPAAVERARGSWTEVAINEYRAVASFSEVLRALVDVKAPLDLLGMTSDFLADEVHHVELASRMAMALGGAAPRTIDLDRFAARPRGLTRLQRANELVLRVSCVAEAFSGGTATVSYDATTHELPRAVYEKILRDESLHRRLGGLYFEWAFERIDEAELARLGSRARLVARRARSVLEEREASGCGRRRAPRARVARELDVRPRGARGRAARRRRAARDARHRAHRSRARRARSLTR